MTIRVYKDGTTSNTAYVDRVSLVALEPGIPLSQDPIGQWQLNESSGTTASDSSGNSFNGMVNGTSSWISGVNGNAIKLDSTTSNVDIGFHNVGSPDGYVGQHDLDGE
ncbi:hypothetical protein [Paenibacillus roseipurpureus]|uniref:Uncharacterized protein n=1 Tax=Paenibacillus roseopurpureus TaxID=2918901 RepID=A0AA96RIG5_9BACL|nr:hypothetical protein [Paenibacillus sp. MBLB1832]WNR42785.1 hypothetical protein MJB10_16855 [Paenibacillus sp. MBLB1832]